MNTVLKVAKKALPAASIYLVIFLGLVIAFSLMGGKDKENNFKAKEMNIVLQDADQSTLSKSLAVYLAQENNVSINENEELLPDLLFNGKVDYIITIEKGFEEKVQNGDYEGSLIQESIRANAAFLDQKVELFIRYLRTELATGKDVASACKSVLAICKQNVETEMIDGKPSLNFGAMSPIYYFFSYLAYALPAVLIMILGPILQEFYQKDVKMRTDCAKTSTRKQNLTIIGGMSVMALLLYVIFMMVAVIMNFGKVTPFDFLLGVLNCFVFLIISIALSSIIGMLVKGKDALNGASNLVSMGMAFLCGIFVPSEFLPQYVQKIGDFLPASWYMKNVKLLYVSKSFNGQEGEYFKNIGIMLIFAGAFLCLALVAAKKKRTI